MRDRRESRESQSGLLSVKGIIRISEEGRQVVGAGPKNGSNNDRKSMRAGGGPSTRAGRGPE